MINTAGPYLLILVLSGYNQGGLAIQELDDFDTCNAALTQLEPAREIYGYCIAKELMK